MQREQNLWGLRCLLWPAHAKLLIYAADSVLAFQFQAPTASKMRVVFSIVSLPLSIILHIVTRFWTVFGRVHTFICLRFFAFFPHTSFYAFSHLRIPFFCFLLFLLFIFITVFLYLIFPRTCFIALNFILLRASFDATISLSVSVFVSIHAQRQASYNSFTSLLPQNSCYHAYFNHFRMVSS